LDGQGGNLHLITGIKELALFDFNKVYSLGDAQACSAVQELRL